jgi:alkaline phosphatase
MSQPRSTSRRDFLKFAGLGSLAWGAAATAALGETPRDSQTNTSKKLAKSVIFMVADGMNIATWSLADAYLQRTVQGQTHWRQLYNERPVVRALCETHSASSIVTDSSAAASCWGIGHRIVNGVVNIMPDGSKPETLFSKMRMAHKRTGLVTTATATHATPAGFVAQVASRKSQSEIANQYLENGVDVIMGGGAEYFSEPLIAAYQQSGYQVVTKRHELLKADPTRKLLGIFSKRYIPYEVDRLHDAKLKAEVPTLSEMTSAALAALEDSPHGFMLMVEGGRVDHAAHANDAPAIIHDMLAFDAAIQTVLNFIDRSPDTLLIITTDHGTGGIQLNGLGDEDFDTGKPAYTASTPAFMTLTQMHQSQEVAAALTKGQPKAKLVEMLVQNSKLNFKATDLAKMTDLKTFQEVLPAYTGINWTSHAHTADLVEFCALGPGARQFSPFIRNDEVHHKILKATGLAV